MTQRRIVKHKIDGNLLERWFLKTAVNTWYPYSSGIAFGPPPLDVAGLSVHLANAAFGRSRLLGNAGLYAIVNVSEAARLVEGTFEAVSTAMCSRRNRRRSSALDMTRLFEALRFRSRDSDSCCGLTKIPNRVRFPASDYPVKHGTSRGTSAI